MRINKSGFTIVELVVVIVVIAILATLVFVSYRGIQSQSRDDRRRTDVANIEKAMELYYDDNGAYPSPTGATGSVINSGWYTSGDGSWDILMNKLVPDSIDALPVDPTNTSGGKPYTTDQYVYAIYVNTTGGYCGSTNGQMYLIVYKLEKGDQESKTDGNCPTKPISSSYYTGASTYLNVKQ